MRGYSGLVVYADDFVVCFQYKDDAEKFYELLKRRMKHFGLSLEEKKSRLIEFGRFAEENRRRKGKGKPAEPKKPEGSYTWEKFRKMQEEYPLVPAKIYVSVYDS